MEQRKGLVAGRKLHMVGTGHGYLGSQMAFRCRRSSFHWMKGISRKHSSRMRCSYDDERKHGVEDDGFRLDKGMDDIEQEIVLGPVRDADEQDLVPRPVQASIGCAGFLPVNITIPENPCEQCGGTGKTICGMCRGKGRVNFRKEAMLPKGKWPVWCYHCRASGKWTCEKCYGTGRHRDPIGFRM